MATHNRDEGESGRGLFIIFWNEFRKPQRAQRTPRKKQLSVHFRALCG